MMSVSAAQRVSGGPAGETGPGPGAGTRLRREPERLLVRTPDAAVLADLVGAAGGHASRDGAPGTDTLVVTGVDPAGITEIAVRAWLVLYEVTPVEETSCPRHGPPDATEA